MCSGGRGCKIRTMGKHGSHAGGGFTEAYSIATDQQGNLYVGEAWEGKRVQRFLLQTAPARR